MSWEFAGSGSSPLEIIAGTQIATSGTISFVNSNGMSFGLNGLLMTASFSQGSVPAAIVAGTQTASTGTVVLSNSNGVTFGMSNSSVITAQMVGPNERYVEFAPMMTMDTAVNLTSVSRQPLFIPFVVPAGVVSANTIRFYADRNAGTTLSITVHCGFYTVRSTNQISLESSTSMSLSLSAVTQWNGIYAYEVTGLSNYGLTQGRYVCGLLISASASGVMNLALLGGVPPNVVGSVFAGTNSTGATNATDQLIPFCGVYTASSSALPTAVSASQVSGNSPNVAQVYGLITEI